MLTGKVRPTTLSGVKSLAAQMSKELGIKHSRALDLAAQAANCTNFRNAQRTLPLRLASPVRHYVLISIYWSDKKQGYRCGRETLKIEISKPILEICSKSALKAVRGFNNLRMVAEDHFVCDALAQTQDFARDRLCVAERSLRFMEHTGLQPSRNHRKVYPPNGSVDDKLPSSDHVTKWIDPACGQFILIDEPYRGAPDEPKRAAWSARTGWRIVKASWPGMYYPYSCDLYAASDCRSGYDLDALVAKIDALPTPLIDENWSGDSVTPWDEFVSPKAKSPQDIRRARCRGTIFPTASATTVPYSYSLGSSRRRPAASMAIDDHVMAGRIIKAVIRSDLSCHSVDTRMNALRSTLEDWMSLEIKTGKLDGPEFFDVYYNDTESDMAFQKAVKSRAGIVEILGGLKQCLLAAYPDCAPLRQQIQRIDMSVSLINKMERAGK